MAHQSDAQKETVARVMHEFKRGELEKRDGEPVKNPKQAIAIALHEAGASNAETPAKNRDNLRKTKRRERAVEAGSAGVREDAAVETRATIYAEAKRRGIPGRSKMSKSELAQALKA